VLPSVAGRCGNGDDSDNERAGSVLEWGNFYPSPLDHATLSGEYVITLLNCVEWTVRRRPGRWWAEWRKALYPADAAARASSTEW
jgi:hypothetical protein